jgi:polyvinyl alcohol dehydrogenase (cytochrome)
MVATAAALALLSLSPAQADPSGEWSVGGQNLGDTHSQPDTAITPRNVSHLTQKWAFTTGGDVTATPAVVDGTVYFPDWAGNFFAVDAATGKALWSHQLADWTHVEKDLSRTDPAVDGDTVVLGDQGGSIATFEAGTLSGPGARVIAVDARNGEARWVTQVEAFPGAIITSSPAIHDGVVYVGVSSTEESLAAQAAYPCCIFQGSVVALDERTGRVLWKTGVMPSNHGAGGGYSGGAVWDSTPAIDPERHAIYVGTGNNYTVPTVVDDCIEKAQKDGRSDSSCNGVDGYGEDHFDSVLALDLGSGAIKWTRRLQGYDAWTVACLSSPPGVDWCPSPAGRDYDFGGAGPNLASVEIGGRKTDIVGAGQKSGVFWAIDRDTGNVVWHTLVGPGGPLGGIEWGTATDGRAFYVPLADTLLKPYRLEPSGKLAKGGSWAALDAASGRILWQTATPGTCPSLLSSATGGCAALGPTTVAGGVVFVASMDPQAADPTMFALDAASGKTLWSFAAGSSVNAAPAIVGDTLYWGSGYGRFGAPATSGNDKLYAFHLEPDTYGPVPPRR